MDNSLDYLPQMFALLEPRAFPLSKQRLNRVRRRERSQRPAPRLGEATRPDPQASAKVTLRGVPAARPGRTPGGRAGGGELGPGLISPNLRAALRSRGREGTRAHGMAGAAGDPGCGGPRAGGRGWDRGAGRARGSSLAVGAVTRTGAPPRSPGPAALQLPGSNPTSPRVLAACSGGIPRTACSNRVSNA